MFWRRFVIGMLIAINFLLLYRLIWSEQGFFSYQELEAAYMRMEKKIESLEANNKELSQEIRLLQEDKRFIEKTIRERMNYVKANEKVYVPERTNNASQGETAHGQQD